MIISGRLLSYVFVIHSLYQKVIVMHQKPVCQLPSETEGEGGVFAVKQSLLEADVSLSWHFSLGH